MEEWKQKIMDLLSIVQTEDQMCIIWEFIGNIAR